MGSCLFFLLLLQLSRNAFSQEEEEKEKCFKAVIRSCGDCITSGPYCMWCKQLNFTKQGERETVRCDTRSLLLKRGCPEDEIFSPENYYAVVKDAPLSKSYNRKQQETIQLHPQEVQLKLWPGKPSTFTISFKRVEGYPIDLYYLMDLSYSMEDDLRNIKVLGRDLFVALRKITERAQIGFGAFVDKTVLPFTNTNKKKLKKPCEEKEQSCQEAFGYRHVLSMTANETKFNQEVKKENISGNLDTPEGSLDAMMQAVVCAVRDDEEMDKIGWRNSSTRIIVLTTDAGFHMAGDGKLAGILEPNDEQCHMEKGVYSMSNQLDYPTVGQLVKQLEKNNIQPIFAVTKEVADIYMQLKEQMIPKSEVEVLSADSKNVVDLIKRAYNRLSSKVIIGHEDLPKNVRVTYTPICPNGGPAGDTTGVCDDVVVGQEISFNVTVTVSKCMEGKESFVIRPQSISDMLKVTIWTNCDCKCDDPLSNQHPYCNGKGKVECGVCSCVTRFVGQRCECSTEERDDSEDSLRESCRRDNGTECEGRGTCVCGRCSCHPTGGGTSYHGDFCECDDEHCEMYQNKLCAGNGRCHCGNCLCDPEYEGTDCHCKKSDQQCRTLNGTVCNGRGNCTCSKCNCNDGYQGPFCKDCHGCPDPCQTKLTCIECLWSETGPFRKNCTEACKGSVKHSIVDTFTLNKKQCRQKDKDGCWLSFRLEQLVGVDNYTSEIQRTRECPELPNIYAIIGGSIAGVAIIGLLILLIIKLLIHLRDLKEFRKFEKEKNKSKWSKDNNPLFKNATTTVANPIFTGESVPNNSGNQ